MPSSRRASLLFLALAVVPPIAARSAVADPSVAPGASQPGSSATPGAPSARPWSWSVGAPLTSSSSSPGAASSSTARARAAASAAAAAAAAAAAPPPAPSPSSSSDDLDDSGGFGEPTNTAPVTIVGHRYTLAECLALADRNFPNLWAARSRLAYAHAQLEEAKWTPWFQWSANSTFGVAPAFLGSVLFPQAMQSTRNITSLGDLTPFFGFSVNGTVPLYTFGKIEAARDAAEANVRVSEWDMEKARQQMRMDVRRAYYGLQLARDAKDVFTDALDRLDKGIKGIKDRLARADKDVNEVDRYRLQTYREEVLAQSLQAPKGEAYALAGLRFLTGVQTGFDVPDEPLKRPDRPLVAIAQYLEAARVLRPDVNMARAGVVARRALVDLNRAKLYPDFGLGLGADFVSTPSATPQENLFASDPFNHFYYAFGFGFRWSLDLLPQAARLDQAESQLEETRALERLALGGAAVEVEKAYADAVEAKTREEAWDRAEHLAKAWISTTQDQIDLGTWDERALLEPLRSYANARGQHLFSLMDLNVAMSSLALASGWDSAAPTE
ncbi:MAG TPA: TolC family protein [Polyangiaceae bacterium]|jgi:outer membrane protein TolC|nr:TolC family protein [Polyangiaceae bacterium]